MRVSVYIDDERTDSKGLHYTLFNFSCVNNVFERGRFMEWLVNNGFSKHFNDPTPTI